MNEYLTITRPKRSEYCRIIIRQYSLTNYSTIFTGLEANNCFSIIVQVIIRETALLLFYSFFQKHQEIARR